MAVASCSPRGRALELLSWLVPLYLFGLLSACGLLFVAIVAPWPYYSQMLASSSVNVIFNGFFQVGQGCQPGALPGHGSLSRLWGWLKGREMAECPFV